MLKQFSKKAVSLLMAFTMLFSFVPATAVPIRAISNSNGQAFSGESFVSDDSGASVFASKSTDAFKVESYISTKTFSDLQAALNQADKNVWPNKKVVLINDTTVTGNYTIPSGVKLCIPCDNSEKVNDDKPNYSNSSSLVNQPSNAYHTLTMAENSSITVKGSIIVGGHLYEPHGGAKSKIAGSYGLISMKSNSKIYVEDGGTLSVWGFVAGTGSVQAKKGSTIYECYQINDFRGGNATKDMREDSVFPLSQYYVQNVEVPLTFYAGAEEKVFAAVYAGSIDNVSEIKFVGSDGLFSIQSGTFTKEYDGQNDRMKYTVSGTAEMNSISLRVQLVNISSNAFVLPITNNMTVNLSSGAKLTVNQDVALLPGVQLNIAHGAEFVIPSKVNMYVYDSEDWGKYCGAGNYTFVPVQYAYGKVYTRTDKDLSDAKIDINGVLSVNGALYTTAGGAQIVSSKQSGKIVLKSTPASSGVTKQVTQSDTTPIYHDIPVTAAKLRNSDNGFTETSKAAAGLTISNIRGVWGNEIIYYVNNKVVHTDLLPFASAVSQLYEYPKRDGYTLSSWETAEHTPAPEIMPADAVKLYATEAPIKYTVTYDGLDGAINPSTNPKSYTVEDSFQLSEPQKTGYEFLGWSYTENSIQKQSKTFSVKKGTVGDIKLTAQWKKTDYSVRYIIDGAEVYTETHNYEESVGVWIPDAKTGYSFSGWTSSDVKADGGLFTMPAGNVTFTGSYLANKYTVYFGANGGSGVMEPQSFTYDTEQKLNENKFQKDDYVFVGWTMNGRELADGELVKNLTSENNGIVYLSAQWQVKTYTVSFDSDGGANFESVTLKNGEKYPELPIPEKDGHTFLGWYVDDVAVKGGDIFAYKKDTTLTAKWKVNSYQLKYFVNGKEVKTADVPFGTSLSDFYAYQKTGYTVSAWRQANGSVMPETMPSKALELYATSEPVIYSITYKNIDGATVPSENPTSYTVEDEFGIAGASKTGYNFIGWLVDGEGSPYKVYPLKRNTVGNLVLVAKWSVKSHDVRYVVDGESYKTVSCDFDSVHSLLPYPEKLGYTFSGWTVTGAAVVDGKLTVPDNDVTVTGTFTPNSYTVFFDANGGTGEMNPQKFTYDAKQKLAKNEFTKVGHSFDGWTNGDNTYADEEEALNLTDVANGSVTLIAKWKVNKYTISFDTDGGTDIAPITSDFGAVVIAPEAPEKSGYEFVGWDVDIPKTMPAKDIKITAMWDSYLDKIECFDDFDGESLTVARGYYTKLNAEQRNSSSKKLAELVEAIKADGILKLTSAIKESLTAANLKLGEKARLTLSDNAYFELMFSDETLSIASFGETGILSDILSNELLSGIKLGSQPVGGNCQDIISAVAGEAGYSFSDKVAVLDGKVMNVNFVGETAEKISFEVPYEIEFFNEYHLVSWNANGGTLGGEYSDGRVAYGTTITPPVISNPGYEFTGWSEAVGTMGKRDIQFVAVWMPMVYNVTFDPKGGTVPAMQSKQVTYGTLFGELAVSSRTGYSFVGWFDGDKPVDESTEYLTVGDVTLSAHWIPKTYRMSFDSNGGDAIPDRQISYDSAYGELPVAEREGYSFDGWFVDGKKADENTVHSVDGDVVLTAEWTVNTYILSYYVGGVKVHEESLQFGESVKPYTYVLTGYDIGEWINLPQTMPARDLSVHAVKTAHIHSVTYKIDNKAIITFDAAFGTELSVLDDEKQKGYTFSGWGSTNVVIKDGKFTMPDSDVIINGSFTPNKYTVVFDGNGGIGEMSEQKFVYGEAQTLLPNLFEKEGYTFKGWRLFGTDTIYNDGHEVLNLTDSDNGTVKLVAEWSVNRYKIIFDTKGGNVINPIDVNFGTEIVSPENPVKDGYEFVGWDVDIPKTMPAKDIKITAMWDSYLDKIERFDDFDGESLTVARGYYTKLNAEQRNSSSEKLAELVEAIKADGILKLTSAIKESLSTANLKLGEKARLTLSDNAYFELMLSDETLSIASFGETGILSDILSNELLSGIKLGSQPVGGNCQDIISAVAREAGYSVSDKVAVLDGKVMNVNFVGETAEKISFEVPYEIEFFNEYHLVSWDANGGTLGGEYSDGRVAYGTTITPPAINRTGYEFNGWNESVGMMGKKDVEFSASWSPVVYTVSFDSDGGTEPSPASKRVAFNTGFGALPTTSRIGYSFEGWFFNDKRILSADILETPENITLKAKWTAKSYSLIFDTAGGEAIANGSVLFDGAYGELPVPKKEGYSFVGWALSDGEMAKADKIHTIDSDVTLTAVWSVDSFVLTYFVDNEKVHEEILEYGSLIPEYIYSERGYDIGEWTGLPKKMPAENVTVRAKKTPHKHSIVYYVDGAVAVSFERNYNEVISIEREPEKLGYTFSGWTVTGAAVVDGKLTVPDNDVTVTGRFTPNSYTVFFDANGGTGEMNPQKFTYDAKQKLAKNEFTKVGYSFDGWTNGDNTYADEEEALNLTDVANGSVTLIAKWKVNKYTISFDTDGGTDIAPITSDFGAVVIAPEAPEKSGYEFVGWDVDIPKTMPAKDIKITAMWDSYLDKIERFDDFDDESLTVARGYYTKLNAEQRNSSSEKLAELVEAIKADGILKLTSAIKESLTAANLKLGEKARFTLSDSAYFELMFSDETLSIASFGETGILSDILSNELLSGIKLGSQPVGGNRQDIISAVAREAGYSVSDKVAVLDGKVMNVNFVGETAEKISFEVPYEIEFFNEYHLVSWNANGGTLGGEYSDGRVAYGTTITPPAINRTGYEFNGWNESVGTMGKKDVEFSASWSPVVYTVSFDSDGGTEPSPASKLVAFNAVFGALPTVSRVGYTFAGWYFNDDVINADDILKTADNITLKAKWLANRYRMTFDSDGGDAIPPKNITFGDSFGELPTPTKTGYTFIGWRNGDIAVDSDTVLNTDGDITLTAVWSVNFYTVSYFVGDEKVHEESLAYGSPLPEYSYVEYGYDIGEWQPNFETMPANNIEIRATKTPHIHLVKYIVDGTEILLRRYSFNENVTVSADQTKTGYTFSGWTAYGTEIEGGSFKMPDNDVELRGSFTPNVYTVIFDSNGGSGEMKPQKFTYDATERLAKNEFARVGYSFDGWSMGDVDYSDESEILNLSAEQNGSVTLYAKWRINKYTVSFDTAYGGTQLPPITADYGTAIVAPADPVREGYIFDGWDCEIPATMPAQNMTVTAKWISYLELLLSVPDYEGDNLAVARGYYKFLNEDQLAQFGETDEIGYFIEAIYDYSLARLLDAVENAVEPTNKLLEVERGRIATLTLDGNHVDVRFDIEDYLAAAVANINFLTELFGYDEVKSITIGTETVILSGHDSSDQLSIMMAVAKASGVSLSGAGSTTVSVLDGKLLDVTLNCMTDESVEYDATYELEFFNNHHNVAWNPNGGALIGSYTDGMTAYGTQIVAPKATKYGYEFLGWDSDVDRMGKTDIEFNAIWQVGIYTVSYLIDGKTVHTEKVKYGEKIPEFSFTVPGYDVGAWQGLPELMPGEDISVSAEKTVHRHTLIYVVDGTTVSSETVDFGAEVILKNDMHRDGYTFSGWETEDAVIKDGKLIMPDNDVVLYGSYASNNYTVAFDSDGGEACEPISVRVGEKLGTLPMPRRSGYRFVGWFFNGIRVFSETVLEVTADVTLTATWEVVNYRIDYFGDGITSGANPDSYNIESETFELVNPDRDGFDFIGWTGSNGDIPEMKVVVPKGSVGELRFEANWKPTEYRVTFDCEKYYNGEASDEAVVNILERDFAARTVSFTVDASETGKMSAWLVYVSRDGENEELLTADNGIYSISEIYSDTVVKIVTVQRGDINLDGNVDAIDLTLFARFMAGIDNISELGYLAADCNGDGNIDAVDLTLFARYMAGIINDFG